LRCGLRRFERLRSGYVLVRAGTGCKESGLFLEGLLGDEQRKTGWMRAEAAGDPGPWGNRRSLVAGLGCRCLARYLRDYVIEHLADDDAVLVMTRLAFSSGQGVVWRGTAITGSAGKITNCQIGVFATSFASWHAFIDRALYLPKNGPTIAIVWKHIRACRHGLCDQTKLATRMIARAIAAAVPFKWSLPIRYGVGDIEQQLRQAGKAMCSGQ